MSQTGFRQDTKNDFSTRTSKQAWIEDQTFVPLNETNIKDKDELRSILKAGIRYEFYIAGPYILFIIISANTLDWNVNIFFAK